MMKRKWLAIASCLAVMSLSVKAGETEWQAHMDAGDIARKNGNFAGFEQQYKVAIAVAEAMKDIDSWFLEESLYLLADFYVDHGRYLEAEPLYKRRMDIKVKRLSPEHHDVAITYTKLAGLYSSLGRYSEAIPLYKRSLAIHEKELGANSPDVALDLSSLAELYIDQGLYSEAEPLLWRSLLINEKALGAIHPYIALSLNGLAGVYRAQGRYVEAEPLLKRSLSIYEKALGLAHPDVAQSLNNLALIYQAQGRYAEAEPLLKRSLAIHEKSLGTEHPSVATGLNNLAALYQVQKRYAENEPLIKRSLVIWEKAFGPEHPLVATSLNNLAALYMEQGRYPEAEPLYRQSLGIRETVLGSWHPEVATTLGQLALSCVQLGRIDESIAVMRRATGIYTTLFSRKDDSARRGLRAEQRSKSKHFENHVRLLSSAGPAAGIPDAVAAESFEVAQWARASDTAEQVAKMAARHAAGSDALARVARERQDLLAYLEKLEADILAEVSKPTDKRSAERDRNLRQSEAETKNRLHALDERIVREFPSYGELTQPKPLAVAEALKLLAPDEALLLWLVGEKESYLWAVRHDRAAFHKLDMPRAELDAAVRSLRLHLDLGASSDPEQLLAQPFDAVRAHALYAKLFGPAGDLLKGAKHLILVPDGPLQGLPPAVLVTEAPKTPVDHREVAWLIKKYALTVLPSANSLRALRAFAARTPGKDPLIGFGDPVLEGRGADGGTRNRGPRVPAGLISRGAVADPKEVRQMDPLPNTADELKRIAASLKAPASALHLGAQATETRVKQVDLSRARVLAFATHGLMAEEFQGMAEPALVLTPPAEASAQDDGLLTASEISQLRLNADWVVLSACNTAASDGKPGAEGLSGLSRAFFYAGARALMVSHWAVETSSAAALTTGAFAQSAKGLSKAEALRQSMLALMGRKDIPYAAHPALWAPFVVVGEGGKR